MVMCGTIDALWPLGSAADPEFVDMLDSLVPLVGTRDESDAIEYIYRAQVPISFSSKLPRSGASHLGAALSPRRSTAAMSIT